MGRDSADFRIAAALLAIVICAVVVIAAIRIHAAGGIEAAMHDDRGLSVFRDWWNGVPGNSEVDDCLDFAQVLADGANPFEDELTTSGENHTEVVDGRERGWSFNASTYRDERAARDAYLAMHHIDTGVARCFPDEITKLPFPVEVAGGYGVGQVHRLDGEVDQTYTALWLNGATLGGIRFWTAGTGDISGWVRAEYESARSRWDAR